MDPDLVRLILVVFGVVLVVGIYLWDRYKKRAAPSFRRSKQMPSSLSIESAELDPVDAGRAEPTIDDVVESIPEMRIEDSQQIPDAREVDQDARSSGLDPDPADLGDWSGTGNAEEPQFSMDLNFDAHGDSDYLSTDPALYDEVERKIVVINLVKRDGAFSGATIDRACNTAGLVLGDMSIYHRQEAGSGRVLFSMASMVEPGTFPVDHMGAFSTPGLTLFTQLPGVRDSVEIYDDMLSTGESLANLLQAELQDERHNKLTRQMQEHTRESIIEHRRKIKLARSRN